jgi:hypothetical protein
MYSKNNATGDKSTAVEPVLKPDATWLYFNNASPLDYFYPDNKRPQLEKLEANKISPAFAGILDSITHQHFLSWDFENTGDIRYLSNTLNPG